MSKDIEIRIEGKRGCGYRKVGALYLVSYEEPFICGALPIPLNVCPCCGQGFKPARGWTWVDADEIKKLSETAQDCTQKYCSICPLSPNSKIKLGQAGLIWVGEKFYRTPNDFEKEARIMGVSRRINSIPRGFKVGKTWILLAHRKAIPVWKGLGNDTEYKPGIFRVFKPIAIEVICDGTESKKKINEYRKRGLTPVIVKQKI